MEFRNLIWIIFTMLSLLSFIVAEDLPEVNCTIEAEELCLFDNLRLPRNGYRFTPISKDPKIIKILGFTDSTVPIFSRDFCDAFPNLEQISIINIGLESFETYAFENCGRLKYLQAFNNQIRSLPPLLFRSTRNIQEIDLHNNRIKGISADQFAGLRNLEILVLSENDIDNFPVDSIMDTNLHTLELQTNDITYLDVEALVDRLPNLQALGYQYNELACIRVEQYNRFLKEHRVYVIEKAEERIRYYDTQMVDGISCLPDRSWAAVQYRKDREREHRLDL